MALIKWLGDCPRCQSTDLDVEVHDFGEGQVVGNDYLVQCPNCKLEGHTEVFDTETVGIYWDEEEYN